MVANLKAAGDTSFKVDVNQPYAEMWIGTHPSGPSNLLTNSGNIGPLLKVGTVETMVVLDGFLTIGKRVDASNLTLTNDASLRVVSNAAARSST